MTTGKIEYAPDYKSKDMSARSVAARIDKIINTDLDRQREYARLRDAVVEAAKRWSSMSCSTAPDEIKADSRSYLHNAVDALNAFESQHGLTK